MSEDLIPRLCDQICRLCGKVGASHYLALISNSIEEDTEFTVVVCPQCATALAEAYAEEGHRP